MIQVQCAFVSITESRNRPVIRVRLSVKVPLHIDLHGLAFGHVERHESLVTKFEGRVVGELILNLDSVLETIVLFLTNIGNSLATPRLRRNVNCLLHVRSECHGVMRARCSANSIQLAWVLLLSLVIRFHVLG